MKENNSLKTLKGKYSCKKTKSNLKSSNVHQDEEWEVKFLMHIPKLFINIQS